MLIGVCNHMACPVRGIQASVPAQMLALRALCNAFDPDLGFMQDSVGQLIKVLSSWLGLDF